MWGQKLENAERLFCPHLFLVSFSFPFSLRNVSILTIWKRKWNIFRMNNKQPCSVPFFLIFVLHKGIYISVMQGFIYLLPISSVEDGKRTDAKIRCGFCFGRKKTSETSTDVSTLACAFLLKVFPCLQRCFSLFFTFP